MSNRRLIGNDGFGTLAVKGQIVTKPLSKFGLIPLAGRFFLGEDMVCSGKLKKREPPVGSQTQLSHTSRREAAHLNMVLQQGPSARLLCLVTRKKYLSVNLLGAGAGV